MGRTTQRVNPTKKKHAVTETITRNMNNSVNGLSEDSSQEATIGSMTASSESSNQEAKRQKESFLRLKHKIKVGAWNVRTMYETSKSAQVTKEMKRFNIDILGISECRWTGSGKTRLNSGHTILYSGQNSNHISGVAIIISKEVEKTLLQWQPINDRLITARFIFKFCKLTIIQCYAPTNEADEEDKNDFYDQLQAVFNQIPQHDMILVTGDLNAKVGSDNTNIEQVIRKHGCDVRNENGKQLVDFCLTNRCIIGDTVFPHKNIHKLTWKSPDGNTVNQIDHVLIHLKWRRSLLDIRSFRVQMLTVTII